MGRCDRIIFIYAPHPKSSEPMNMVPDLASRILWMSLIFGLEMEIFFWVIWDGVQSSHTGP